VSGRRGSGSFAAAAAPLGMPLGKIEHHPGWKPLQGSAAIMSQAGLQARAGSRGEGSGARVSSSFPTAPVRCCHLAAARALPLEENS